MWHIGPLLVFKHLQYLQYPNELLGSPLHPPTHPVFSHSISLYFSRILIGSLRGLPGPAGKGGAGRRLLLGKGRAGAGTGARAG